MTASLKLFATQWSVRWYPSQEKEWSWAEKFSAIRDAGFDGVMSTPITELRERGDLAFWAIGSFGVGHDLRPFFEQSTALGAAGATVQPCDVETPLEECVEVVRNVQKIAREFGLHTGIETHRDTFTETPERTWDMADGYQRAEQQLVPLCFDHHSHFAVVRHLSPPY